MRGDEGGDQIGAFGPIRRGEAGFGGVEEGLRELAVWWVHFQFRRVVRPAMCFRMSRGDGGLAATQRLATGMQFSAGVNMTEENELLKIMAAFSMIVPSEQIPISAGYDKKLGALFTHFVAAEAVEFHLRRSIESVGGLKSEPPTVTEVGDQFSAFHVISVYYAMIFVVLEGYAELKLSDPKIDALIKDTDKVETLRRFRNGIFHFQERPMSPKITDHLDGDRQGEWTRGLAKEFCIFFERELKLASYIEAAGLHGR
jgi:hypothetical protein